MQRASRALEKKMEHQSCRRDTGPISPQMLPDELQERVTLLASNPILRDGRLGAGKAHERAFFAQQVTHELFSAHPIDHTLPALPRVVASALSCVSCDREVHLGPWTFLSPEGVRERHAALGFPMFAHKYAGMGHITCLGYCPERDVVFKYLDGGANGFERIENAKRARAFTVHDMCARQIDLDKLLRGAASEPYD